MYVCEMTYITSLQKITQLEKKYRSDNKNVDAVKRLIYKST